jgi:hypothetical protein
MRSAARGAARWLTVPVVAVATMVVLLAAFAIHEVRPFLTPNRPQNVGTPVPTALFNLPLLSLKGHDTACLLDVSIPTDAERASFTPKSYGKPGPPLTVEMSGPSGYRSVTRVPAGWVDGVTQHVAVQPPEQSLRGSFCLRNDGRRPIALNAIDRPATPTQQVNGVFTTTQMSLSFERAQEASLLHRIPELMRRASYFTWPGVWFLYVIAVLVLVGVPLGIVYAFASVLRADEDVRARRRDG